MATTLSGTDVLQAKDHEAQPVTNAYVKRLSNLPYPLRVQTNARAAKWHRSTFYNAIILGLCNFLAPGIWGAMNSLGAGGEEKPYLVNGANALTCTYLPNCTFRHLPFHSILFIVLLL